MKPGTEVVEADLARAEHQQAVVALTAAYAIDEMGNGRPLPADVLERLIPGLRAHPTTLILLAYVDGKAISTMGAAHGYDGMSLSGYHARRPSCLSEYRAPIGKYGNV